MTSQAMQASDCSPPLTVLRLPAKGSSAVASPTPAQLFQFAVAPTRLPPGFRDISDVIADRERDAEKAARLERARQRLHAKLPADEAPTLARLRLRRGLSQAKLAQMIGTSQPAVAMFETGRREPAASNIAGLAAALGVTSDTILEALGVKARLMEPGNVG